MIVSEGEHRHRDVHGGIQRERVAELPPSGLETDNLQAPAMEAFYAVSVPRATRAELPPDRPLLVDVHEPAREAALPRAAYLRYASRVRHVQVLLTHRCDTVHGNG